MKTLIALILLIVSISSFGQQELSWEFYHPLKKEWFSFGKSGSIQEKLMDLKELPTAIYSDNEKEFQWIEDHVWKFRSTFYLTEKEASSRNLILQFPNIDTYGEIMLNNQIIGSTDNFFRPYEFEIQKSVICGYNTLLVTITPPVLFHKSRYESEDFHYPAPNDPAKMKVAPLSRKPQYQFGWDWALRMNTIGFSKPISIIPSGFNAIKSCVVNTLYQSSNIATLLYILDTKKPLVDGFISSSLFGKRPLVIDSLKPNHFLVDFQLENPKLWWPVGFGEPNLYLDTLKLLNADGLILDKYIIEFGVRTAKLVQNKDEWGTSYEFHVNDIPIFCKGANYIPQSVFPAAVKDSAIENMIDQMLAANFNMVRVWGGGYYPDNIFYKTCDKKGVLVWQDLMFACAMYPGDSTFLKSVEEELNYQIPRISAHPSVILLNGNNEVDMAWKNWGFQLQYFLKDKSQKIIEKAYDDLFNKLAKEVASNWTSTSYIHTSPLSNWGKDEFYNHGSQHYWGVWHGSDPLVNFTTKIGRFNAEYGFQSFPEFSSLAKFSAKEDWSLTSKVMKHHQKSYVGNSMIEKQAKLLYGKSKSFEEFVYHSQLTQANAISSAINSHRLDAPRCMGTLYWQLNDCWPAPTWSSIDYYGSWKALHYAVRDDYRQIAVLKKIDSKGNIELFLKSDDPKSNENAIQLSLEVYSLDGKLLSSKSQKLSISYMEHLPLGKFQADNKIVKVRIGNDYDRVFLLSKEKTFKTKLASAEDITINLNAVDTINKTAVIEINNNQFLADFWLYSAKIGVTFEKNFIQLLPGKHQILIHFNEIPEQKDFACFFR